MTSSTIGSSQSAKYCVGFVLLERKRRRRKTTTSFIRQNEKQYLEGTLALARHDPTLYCDSSLNFVAQIGMEVTERKSIN
jgi:hypothetical protein